MNPLMLSPVEAIVSSLNCPFRLHGGEGENDPKDPPQSGGASGGNGTPGSSDPKKSGGTDDDDPDAKIAKLTADLDAEKKLRIKAQKDLDKKAKDEVKEFENVEAERDDFKEKYEKILKFVETEFIDWQIAKNDEYKFHDPEGVRAFIDRNNIRVDLDTGEIEGLDLELKRIATDPKKQYLLVAPDADQNGNPPGTPPPPPPGAGTPMSGSHPFGGSPRQRETDKTKLGQKYNIPGYRHPANSGARPM